MVPLQACNMITFIWKHNTCYSQTQQMRSSQTFLFRKFKQSGTPTGLFTGCDAEVQLIVSKHPMKNTSREKRGGGKAAKRGFVQFNMQTLFFQTKKRE